MPNKKNKLFQKTNFEKVLRERAEQILKDKNLSLDHLSDENIYYLFHELDVYQVELEIQNEELRNSQARLEEAKALYEELYDFAPVGYFTFNKKGTIENVNLTGAGILGLEKTKLIGQPFHKFICKEDQDIFYLHLKQVFKPDISNQRCELKIVDKEGKNFCARLESVPVKNQENNFFQCRTVIIDIT